jgi:hypothetical protein
MAAMVIGRVPNYGMRDDAKAHNIVRQRGDTLRRSCVDALSRYHPEACRRATFMTNSIYDEKLSNASIRAVVCLVD